MFRFLTLQPAGTRVSALVDHEWRTGTVVETAKNQCQAGYHYIVDLDNPVVIHIPVRLGVQRMKKCKRVVVDAQHVRGEATA